MLELRDVHAFYGDSHILQGVDLEVHRGEIVCLLGRNGVGKTTTLRTIMGLTRHQGSIRLSGEEISRLDPWERCRKGIGFIPEDRRIFSGLSVEENLRTAMWASARKGHWTAAEVYGAFPILYERRWQLGSTLSGGEQQMLAIGRALLGNPELLLLDEPSQGLSPVMVKVFTDMIHRLHGLGLTVLLVEQNVRVALGLSRRTYVLNKGRVVYHADSEQLRRDQHITKQYLGV